MIYHSIFKCEYDCNVERLVREFMVCREHETRLFRSQQLAYYRHQIAGNHLAIN